MLRQPLGDLFAPRSNAMVGVRDDHAKTEARSEMGQQIQQCHRIGSARHRQQGRPGAIKEPFPMNEFAHAIGEGTIRHY